jgi:hypothetical protein
LKKRPFEADHEDIPLKDTVTFMGDISSSVAEDDWEALSKGSAFGYPCLDMAVSGETKVAIRKIKESH